MPKFKLFPKGRNTVKPIVVRVYFNDTYLVYATGETVGTNWDVKTESIQPLENSTLKSRKAIEKSNKVINRVRGFVETGYNNLHNQKIEITRENLRAEVDKVKLDFETKDVPEPIVEDEIVDENLNNTLERYIQTAPTRIVVKLKRTVSAGIIKTYGTSLKHLKGFETYYKHKDYKFSELDEEYHGKMINYLLNVRALAPSTAGTVIKNIKMISNYAKKKGVEVNSFVLTDDFYKPSIDDSEVEPIYLNEKEIKKVYEYDFSDSEYLDNARDLFVIGLWSGLRISDYKRLTKKNIKNGMFEIVQQKTKGKVVIPIHEQVQSILDKRDGELPRSIGDQNFNIYIKEVCKRVGLVEEVQGSILKPTGEFETIDVYDKISEVIRPRNIPVRRKVSGVYPKFELVTSHCCRRSFATNHYGKLPNMVIMAITGHKSEKTFLHYVKTGNREHAQTLAEYWQTDTELTLKEALAKIEKLKAENQTLRDLVTKDDPEVNTPHPQLKIIM